MNLVVRRRRASGGEGAAGAVRLRGQPAPEPDCRAPVRRHTGHPGQVGGLSDLARVQVTVELLAWADVVFVMERRLRSLLRRRFGAALAGKELVCLEVPDDFQFQQPELVAVLAERLAPHLGPPAASAPDAEPGAAHGA